MTRDEIEALIDLAIAKKVGCLKVDGVEIYPTQAAFVEDVEIPVPSPRPGGTDTDGDRERRRSHILIGGRRVSRELLLRSGRAHG